MNSILKRGITVSFILMIGLLCITPLPRAAHSQNPTPQHIESDDPIVVRAGNWTSQAANQASGGSYLYSSGADDDVLTLEFSGPSIEVIFVTGPSLGTLAISVDDVVLRTVITTADQTAYQQSSRIDYLSDEPHTLKVYAQAGGIVAIDAFVVPTSAEEGSSSAQGSPRFPCDPLPTYRVSESATGTQSNDHSPEMAVSGDGRYVVFQSAATNLVDGDTNAASDLFVYDRQTCGLTRESVGTGGTQGNNLSRGPVLSEDGRYMAFWTAVAFDASDTNGAFDVYVRDIQSNTTTLVSVGDDEAIGNDNSVAPRISDDGRYVAFVSSATNLVPGDTNLRSDVFLRDLQLGTTERISTVPLGQTDGVSPFVGDISDDGRYVVFHSLANNLSDDDLDATLDVFVRDRQTATTILVSRNTAGDGGNADSNNPSMSDDGRYVVFESIATNLVAGDTNGLSDVFVRDLQTNTTTRVSVSSSGAQGTFSSEFAKISGNGQLIIFRSESPNFVVGDTNNYLDWFVHRRDVGETFRVSITEAGGQMVGPIQQNFPAISDVGLIVVWSTEASNIVAGDTNGLNDVFAHDVFEPLNATGFNATTVSTTQIDLTWTETLDGETNWRVERSPDGTTGWTEIATLAANTTSYSNTGLTASTTHFYRVRAYRSADNLFSRYSDIDGARTAPLAPSSLTATTISDTGIDLGWTDNASDETEYRVERSPDGTTGWTEVAQPAANSTSYNNSGLTASTTYYYRVRAFRSSDTIFSAYSNVANARTAPTAPSTLTATSLSQTSIQLNWTDNASDETNFTIERSFNGTTDWSQIGSTLFNVASFTDTVYLTCGTPYYYRVRAYRSGDGIFSAYSDVATATTNTCPPAAPTNVMGATISQTAIRLIWTDNASDETNFTIERSPNGTTGWSQIGSTLTNVAEFTDTVYLACGTPYYYRVRAYRATDTTYSAYSIIIASATTSPCVPDALAIVNPAARLGTVFKTLTSPPSPLDFQIFATGFPHGPGGQYVMGDWNGDGVDTLGVYWNGAFFFTDDYAAGGTWVGIWFGLGGQPVVGRFDANVNHDCLGVTDSGTWFTGDAYFALYFTCNLTSGPTPPLTFQWLSILLPNSQGFTGTYQFVAGDFDGDGVDSVAVRRGGFIAWTNIPPTTLLSQFSLAQYIGAPGTGDEGKIVVGDWDMNNIDSFGLVYQNGTFYRRNDLDWNSGAYILQTFTPSIGTPFDVASWRPN